MVVSNLRAMKVPPASKAFKGRGSYSPPDDGSKGAETHGGTKMFTITVMKNDGSRELLHDFSWCPLIGDDVNVGPNETATVVWVEKK